LAVVRGASVAGPGLGKNDDQDPMALAAVDLRYQLGKEDTPKQGVTERGIERA